MLFGPFIHFCTQNTSLDVKCLFGGNCVAFVGRFEGIWIDTLWKREEGMVLFLSI
jgi:hypothetical protein